MKALLILLCVLCLTACASVTGSSAQTINLVTVCEGAPTPGVACSLSNDKGRWTLVTPGTATLQKSYGDLTVECSSGETLRSATFQSKSNGGVWGDILAGGVIGYAVDAGRGAGFDYPPQITLPLFPPCPKGSAP